VRHPPEQLWQETATVACRFGWSLDAILDLEHADRRRLVSIIGGWDQGR
jgi:hypothetical protein